MTDIVDRAAEREEDFRSDALEVQARRAGLAGKTVSDSALSCSVCEDSIPEGRREAIPGVQTCVACQADLEHELSRVALCPPWIPLRGVAR